MFLVSGGTEHFCRELNLSRPGPPSPSAKPIGKTNLRGKSYSVKYFELRMILNSKFKKLACVLNNPFRRQESEYSLPEQCQNDLHSFQQEFCTPGAMDHLELFIQYPFSSYLISFCLDYRRLLPFSRCRCTGLLVKTVRYRNMATVYTHSDF